MNLSFWRLQRPGKMGGWRRLFVAGTLLLAVAVCAWAWHVQSPDMDAAETAECMLADMAEGKLLAPTHPELDSVNQLMQQKKPNFVSYEDWLRLDELEIENGAAQGRPRIKFTKVADMLAALGK